MYQARFDTRAVHGLYSMAEASNNSGSIIEPLFMSSAQHFEDSDHMEAALAYLVPSWTYTRIANPTVGYLEDTLALLEGYGFAGRVGCCATSSGMAAVFMATNPFLALQPKDVIRRNGHLEHRRMNIVASAKCYGGTFMLFQERYGTERGIDIRWVRNPLDADEWGSLIDDNTRFVFGEMPSNPSLAVFDIEAVAAHAHEHEIPLIVDSTVATPALLRPLRHGADIVVHSVSKAMATSGFAIAGAVVARENLVSRFGPPELRSSFASYVKLLPFRDHGPSLSPFNALMALNDMRSLRMRVDLMSKSAERVVSFLADHPQVAAVRYPGLREMPGYEIAKKYLWLADGAIEDERAVNRFGHLLSFEVREENEACTATRRFFDHLNMIWRGTDLGRIKSVATIPAISTHQQQGDAGRTLSDIPPNLVRLSIGIEHPDDIIADLDQALTAVS